MKLATRAADETENQEAPTGVRVARAIQRLFDSHWATLLAAFAVSALIGLLLITMTGGDPVLAVRITIDSTIGTARGLIDTLVFTTPRLLVALGAIVALRAGIFNLGGEGQCSSEPSEPSWAATTWHSIFRWCWHCPRPSCSASGVPPPGRRSRPRSTSGAARTS